MFAHWICAFHFIYFDYGTLLHNAVRKFGSFFYAPPGVRSRCNLRSSKLGIPRCTNRASYVRLLKPHRRFVNRLCTFSIKSISFLVQGDQIIELYSNIGRTYTINALTNRVMSPEMKQRMIWLALWWAFSTISRIMLCWRQVRRNGNAKTTACSTLR